MIYHPLAANIGIRALHLSLLCHCHQDSWINNPQLSNKTNLRTVYTSSMARVSLEFQDCYYYFSFQTGASGPSIAWYKREFEFFILLGSFLMTAFWKTSNFLPQGVRYLAHSQHQGTTLSFETHDYLTCVWDFPWVNLFHQELQEVPPWSPQYSRHFASFSIHY